MARNSQFLVDLGQGLSLAIGLPTLASWGNNSRPSSAKQGTLGFNIDTKSLEVFDGKKWFTAPLTSI